MLVSNTGIFNQILVYEAEGEGNLENVFLSSMPLVKIYWSTDW